MTFVTSSINPPVLYLFYLEERAVGLFLSRLGKLQEIGKALTKRLASPNIKEENATLAQALRDPPACRVVQSLSE